MPCHARVSKHVEEGRAWVSCMPASDAKVTDQQNIVVVERANLPCRVRKHVEKGACDMAEHKEHNDELHHADEPAPRKQLVLVESGGG